MFPSKGVNRLIKRYDRYWLDMQRPFDWRDCIGMMKRSRCASRHYNDLDLR